MSRRLGYRTLYAMRRPKAWRGGSKAPKSGEPATALDAVALDSWFLKNKSPTRDNHKQS